MNRTKLIFAIAAIAAASLWWALAQPAPAPLETLVPAGAVMYLEARDLGALLRDWDGSPEKSAWLQSSNYAVFSRSHLLLKLADAQNDFAAAAGIPPDYALLNSVAGTNSVLAIYDVGKLEFLYITRLPSARILNTALWRTRATYQTRRAGNVDYYVKTDRMSQKTAAFASTGDLLLLSTRETALAGALELIARTDRPALSSEPWFAQAVASAQPGARDLRLVYNMERLVSAPQFRSHWVQRNTADLREFGAGLADLERVAGEVRERRVILRISPSGDLTAFESAAGQLLAMVPDSAGLYRVLVQPTPGQAERWIAEKLFAESSSAAVRRDTAPFVPGASDSGDESDLETRIDQAPLSDDRSLSALASVRERLAAAPLEAMLEISSTRVDAGQVFVRPQSAVVILAAQPWDASAIRNALADAANGLWTHSRIGVGWRNLANNVEELDGLGRVVMAVDGRRLILGDSADLVNALVARRTQPAVAGAVYAAGWRHARELPNFERMMRLIDFPEIRNAPENTAREPLFYSENLASLGRVLGRVDQASIAVHDTGTMLRETVLYRLTP